LKKRQKLEWALNDVDFREIIRYDTKEEFNVDSKAEYQLNLAHVARKI